MNNIKAYFTRGIYAIEFDILQESKSRTGEPCYLAVIKGTEQMVWLFMMLWNL